MVASDNEITWSNGNWTWTDNFSIVVSGRIVPIKHFPPVPFLSTAIGLAQWTVTNTPAVVTDTNYTDWRNLDINTPPIDSNAAFSMADFSIAEYDRTQKAPPGYASGWYDINFVFAYDGKTLTCTGQFTQVIDNGSYNGTQPVTGSVAVSDWTSPVNLVLSTQPYGSGLQKTGTRKAPYYANSSDGNWATPTMYNSFMWAPFLDGDGVEGFAKDPITKIAPAGNGSDFQLMFAVELNLTSSGWSVKISPPYNLFYGPKYLAQYNADTPSVSSANSNIPAKSLVLTNLAPTMTQTVMSSSTDSKTAAELEALYGGANEMSLIAQVTPGKFNSIANSTPGLKAFIDDEAGVYDYIQSEISPTLPKLDAAKDGLNRKTVYADPDWTVPSDITGPCPDVISNFYWSSVVDTLNTEFAGLRVAQQIQSHAHTIIDDTNSGNIISMDTIKTGMSLTASGGPASGKKFNLFDFVMTASQDVLNAVGAIAGVSNPVAGAGIAAVSATLGIIQAAYDDAAQTPSSGSAPPIYMVEILDAQEDLGAAFDAALTGLSSYYEKLTGSTAALTELANMNSADTALSASQITGITKIYQAAFKYSTLKQIAQQTMMLMRFRGNSNSVSSNKISDSAANYFPYGKLTDFTMSGDETNDTHIYAKLVYYQADGSPPSFGESTDSGGNKIALSAAACTFIESIVPAGEDATLTSKELIYNHNILGLAVNSGIHFPTWVGWLGDADQT
ncbi:MAG: hypothetical protein AAF423_01225 [Pseudomonadota bacterium]